MKYYELFIAWRYMKANIKQSVIISGAVGIGVSIIIFVPSINLSFFQDLIDKTISSSSHITITKELETFKRDDLLIKQKMKEIFLLKDQTLARRRNIISYKQIIKSIDFIKDIEEFSPFARGQAIAVKGSEDRGITLIGVIPEKEVKVIDIEKYMVKGSLRDIGLQDIAIGKKLAEKLKVRYSDKINVVGPRGIEKIFTVGAIFSTGLRTTDEQKAYVALKSAQQIFELRNEVTGIGLKLNDIYQADVIAEEIRKITGLDIKSWMDDNKQILEQITRFKIIIAFINFLIIFSAASSITSVFILLIASKSKEIGILKSMGAQNLSIMMVFLIQAVVYSVFGYCIGLVGAKSLISWYSYILSTQAETFLTTSIPELKINVQYALLALVYSFVTSLIASIIPAYQAAKLNPVEAINE